MSRNELYYKPLEESIIKCADTVQYLKISWIPVTKFLSYLINLVSLEITNLGGNTNMNDLEKGSFPLLKSLKVVNIPSNICKNIIESTKGHLIEICIINQCRLYHIVDDGNLIQKIYQNCPNLKFLKLTMYKEDISEFENLLINCQFLIGLEIIDHTIKWNKLFKILKFSPISLFKFKFTTNFNVLEHNLEDLKLFLDNWKDRNSMLLHINTNRSFILERQQLQQQIELQKRLKVVLQEYKAKGIIKKYDIDEITYKGFKWK